MGHLLVCRPNINQLVAGLRWGQTLTGNIENLIITSTSLLSVPYPVTSVLILRLSIVATNNIDGGSRCYNGVNMVIDLSYYFVFVACCCDLTITITHSPRHYKYSLFHKTRRGLSLVWVTYNHPSCSTLNYWTQIQSPVSPT